MQTKQRGYGVLLVEDDPIVRNTVLRMLELAGHTVTEADNGIAGLKLLRSATFDLIITDIVMPDMEGLEFVRKVRKARTSSRIIAMCGHGAIAHYLELATTFGANAVLSKPFTRVSLDREIERAMTGS